MIDRREVMLKAWEDWRSLRARPAHETQGHDISFASCLRFAWKVHKQAAARVAAEQREAMSPNAPAIRAIREAIEELQFKSFRYDIASERRRLEARLAVLSAANPNVFCT